MEFKILKYYYLEQPNHNKRRHNISVVQLSNELELYVIREDGIINNLEIIPGNNPLCSNVKENYYGKNFWWNNWNNEKELSGSHSILMIGTYDFNNNQLHIHNFYNQFDIYEKFSEYLTILTYVDLRPYRFNNKIFLWNGKHLSRFEENKLIFVLDEKNKFLKLRNFKKKKSFFVTDKIIQREKKENIYELFNVLRYTNDYAKGGNQVILHTNTADYFFDWFYDDGIHIFKIDYKSKLFDIEKNDNQDDDEKLGVDIIIKYNNDPILGLGSTLESNQDTHKNSKAICPLFSFGSPFVKINDNLYIGVGHIKIINNGENKDIYLKNSKIQKTSNYISETFPKLFGNKYKEHYGRNNVSNEPTECHGYKYMSYFIKIEFNDDDDIIMNISDAFLPINTNAEYIFSLIFTIGIMLKENHIIITSGEGDYYSSIISFDKNNIIKSCRHDVTNFNMEKYNFHVLFYNGTDINEIVTNGNITLLGDNKKYKLII